MERGVQVNVWARLFISDVCDQELFVHVTLH
jgi:hypothetical protein